LFQSLTPRPSDPLLRLITLFAEDKRADKIDLGIGVYRDENGITPVFRAVKEAEARLQQTQTTKSYIGPEGDRRFVALVRELAFGQELSDRLGERLIGLQTPGGTGALRLASDVAVKAHARRVIVGVPTWPNHAPIFNAAGLSIHTYDYFDTASQTVQFDRLLDALNNAEHGDVVVLQGCCHNPTGADLSAKQWHEVTGIVLAKGLLPLIDTAYHGLGHGLDADMAPVRHLAAHVPEALITYSCSKNFGLYRERTGILFMLADSAKSATTALSIAVDAARPNYSMPPDHGGSVVRLILDDEKMKADWRPELEAMRNRIAGIRNHLAAEAHARGLSLDAVKTQLGMFSTLALPPEAVLKLREQAAIYMPETGRINVAGLTENSVSRFVAALAALPRAEAPALHR
jgi:aromatic-amino-acid transaminase